MASPSTPQAPNRAPDLRGPIGGFAAFRHALSRPWTRWIGLRYLKSKKNSRFLSFITGISMAGIALGVMAMIIVLSAMDGLEANQKQRLGATDLHILITPTRDVPGFDSGYVSKDSLDPGKIKELMAREPGILSFQPVISTEAILRAGKVSGVVFKGVTPERLARLKTQVTESADPSRMVVHQGGQEIHLPSVFVGEQLAYEMQLIPGDQVTIISPTETEGPLGGIPRLKRYIVEGIYRSGQWDQELHVVFAGESAVRSLVRRPDVVTFWEITLADFERAPQIADEIRRFAKGFSVQDWVQLNSHLFAALRLERLAMFVILAFIIVVASFNIVTTLTLMVIEKKRDIAILKAMGARDIEVAAIFVSEGLLIGCVGTVMGVVLGFSVCAFLHHYPVLQLPDVYYDRTLPVTFNPLYYVLVPCAALAIVLVACLYPSRHAARLNPLDGIRFG